MVADVSLANTDFADPVSVGDNVVYTLAVHNAGPSPAADVAVADTLPSGLTLVSATTGQGSCSGTTTVSCDLGTVAAGAAHDVAVTIVARAGQDAVPSVSNAATASSATSDPDSSNNQATASTTVNPMADLGVTNSDSPDPVAVGDDVTYTLGIHNSGPSPAAAVAVSDALPTGLTLVSAGATKGSCSGTETVSCDIGTVDAGTANDVTVTIVAHAGPDAVPGITNTATVSSSTADPDATNNDASAETTVNPVADLSLAKQG
jgi:uncharacterized repeat protein (TIGR01451 family)